MSQYYYHSIRFDQEKCKGRMKCLRTCPTQAIRVRGRKAVMIEERCIDCGECLNVCPSGAIVPLTDPFGELTRFRHTVAVPSPALYAQFGREILPHKILAGLKKLGFDDAFDLAYTCGEVSFAIQEFLREYQGPKPVISNACPTVVRLIQVKYPDLIDLLIPVNTPREIAAKNIKEKKSKQYGLAEKEIGTFYITPCPVKMISIKQPAEKGKSYLDGALSISDVYGPLLSAMEGVEKESYRKALESICILGIGWAMVGGVCRTLRLRNSLAVSGLTEIIKVFDDIERGRLRDIDFLEAYSCPQGCVGGSLTVENVYSSYNKILKLIETLEFEKIKACPDIREVRRLYAQKYFFLDRKIEPRPLSPLDDDLGRAIKKRKQKEEIYEALPKIDCGACGSPDCLTFAEDVVMEKAQLFECVFMLPERFRELFEELIGLFNKALFINQGSRPGEKDYKKDKKD
ncbi:MAG: [Fe-Fe] hydrogenase large subunit C-terminal domain-containing protein [Clostridiales bacterium]|nr:[Fe-Fe] hydrogenase large subunit C-terminal domain-containing protein [Clostridiales bacterium]